MHLSPVSGKIVTLLMVSGFCGTPARAQQTRIFVSVHGNDQAPGTLDQPVKTLQRAQQLVRLVRKEGHRAAVNVFLRGGTYYLDSPLVFRPEDHAKDDGPVTFQHYHHEKVTLSGGRRLHVAWVPWKNGIYRAKLSTKFDFDQLFINGVKQVRARYPNKDTTVAIFNGVSRDALSAARVKSWRHPRGGVIHALQKSHWGSLSYQITGKDSTGRLTVVGGYQINRSHQIDSAAVFVENILEELDTTREWYYDSAAHLLYYKPPPHLNLRQAKIEVPVLMELVIFSGDTLHPVSHIHFDGITFTHTRETFMLTREPLLRGDWNIFRGGAVLLSGTAHCSFSHCNFESPGGNALFFSDYNRDDTVRHCLIRNAGASGICFVGDPLAVRSPSFSYDQYVPYDRLDKTAGPKSSDFPRDCYVYDNLIVGTGSIEKQTAGVQLSMCMGIQVIHNTIYHVPRAGININDGTWGGNVIEDNDVFETVLETGDHGAFNSWGRDRYWSPDRSYMDSLVAAHPELVKLDVTHPNLIRHNRFRCDHGWDIDLDDGSSNYIIDSNLCLNGGIKLREGFYRTVRNNIMINNTFHPHVWFKDSHVLFMHNIVMRPYAPIRITYWGDSIDYNLFADSAALFEARTRGTDHHSAAEFPSFEDPATGDYRVKMDAAVAATGFRNFAMHDFGVVSPALKRLVPQRVFPVPAGAAGKKKTVTVHRWRGAVLKKVEGPGEQSALGLASTARIYVAGILPGSPAYRDGLRQNDVILQIGDKKIRSFEDLRSAWGKSTGNLTSVEVFRNQQNKRLSIRARK
jgi:hypothetical protein